MNLDEILNGILQREGWPKVTNLVYDKGGLTKGGVTFSSYSAWLKQMGKPPITPTDFPTLTEDEAKDFMLHDIAGPLIGVSLVDVPLFTTLFDWAETSGPEIPTRTLQTLIRSYGADITLDGEYGLETDKALRAVSNPITLPLLRRRVVDARVLFYVRLALRDAQVEAFRHTTPTTDLENLDGWVERALAVS